MPSVKLAEHDILALLDYLQLGTVPGNLVSISLKLKDALGAHHSSNLDQNTASSPFRAPSPGVGLSPTTTVAPTTPTTLPASDSGLNRPLGNTTLGAASPLSQLDKSFPPNMSTRRSARPNDPLPQAQPTKNNLLIKIPKRLPAHYSSGTNPPRGSLQSSAIPSVAGNKRKQADLDSEGGCSAGDELEPHGDEEENSNSSGMDECMGGRPDEVEGSPKPHNEPAKRLRGGEERQCPRAGTAVRARKRQATGRRQLQNQDLGEDDVGNEESLGTLFPPQQERNGRGNQTPAGDDVAGEGPGGNQLANIPVQDLQLQAQSIQPMPEKEVLDDKVLHVLCSFASTSRACISPTHLDAEQASTSKLIRIMETLTQGSSNDVVQESFIQDSLDALVKRCEIAENKEICAQFVYMVNCIQFRAKVGSVSNRLNIDPTNILKGIQTHLTIRTLYRYLSDGAKYCTLAGAGTIYLLAIISCSRTKTELQIIPFGQILRLGALIRCPTKETSEGAVIIRDIIPAISILRQKYPIDFSSMFENVYSTSEVIKASDIEASDDFFDSMACNTFLKMRDTNAWSSCYLSINTTINHYQYHNINYETLTRGVTTEGLQTYSPRIGSPLSVIDEEAEFLPSSETISDALQKEGKEHNQAIIIDTNFDFDLPSNKQLPYVAKNAQLRYRFTQQQRKLALKAVEPQDLDDLKEKLCKQLASGYKTSESDYILVDAQVLNGQTLRINGKDNRHVATIISSMPDLQRSRMMDDMALIYPDVLQTTDSAEMGDKYSYQFTHAVYYSRFSARGDNVPSDQEPSTVQNKERKKARNLKTSQLIPRESEELRDNSEEYSKFRLAFAPIFEWLRGIVKEILPEKYALLKEWVHVLPGNPFAPVYPFGGVVINFNVCTRIHRDVMDLGGICLVLVISDCEGGEICLMEPGLVLRLRSGDSVIFPSSEFSHFNLHFEGKRMSLVFNSDRTSKGWVDNRNGWDNNIYFVNVPSGKIMHASIM